MGSQLLSSSCGLRLQPRDLSGTPRIGEGSLLGVQLPTLALLVLADTCQPARDSTLGLRSNWSGPSRLLQPPDLRLICVATQTDDHTLLPVGKLPGRPPPSTG